MALYSLTLYSVHGEKARDKLVWLWDQVELYSHGYNYRMANFGMPAPRGQSYYDHQQLSPCWPKIFIIQSKKYTQTLISSLPPTYKNWCLLPLILPLVDKNMEQSHRMCNFFNNYWHLMIGMNHRDRNLLYFLWLKEPGNDVNVNSEVCHFQFNRMVFGSRSSPAVLGSVISYHLNKYSILNTHLWFNLLQTHSVWMIW